MFSSKIYGDTLRYLHHSQVIVIFLCLLFRLSAETSSSFQTQIKPFLQKYCIDCHGEKKSKGKVTLHTIDETMSSDKHEETWQELMDVLQSGDMPPDEESKQPSDAERMAVIQWVERTLAKKSSQKKNTHTPAVARRLTNFEYQNTMRDLLGINLRLIPNLSVDPVKPYHFNNTPDLMNIGPEQIDRYLEAARYAMASAIVDPEKPKIHTSRMAWEAAGFERLSAADEVSVFGGPRNTVNQGMNLKSFPKTGEFRLRVQASAILPAGITEAPLRLMMGHNHVNTSVNRPLEAVGTVLLTNSPDKPEIIEFRGRIENYPPRPGAISKGVREPDVMAIQPQIIYNDGTLNDRFSPLNYPRAVINWIEFECPVTETWPPAHHKNILFDSPLRTTNPSAYIAAVLEKFISRAYRRPARREEVERFAKIYQIIAPDKENMEAAMRETLSMVLVSPDFLYHTLAENASTKPFEIASRLSYFLTGSMPDKELFQLAATGKLDSDIAVAEQVRRLLNSNRSSDFIRNFTMQWLSLDKSLSVPINLDLFPRFLYTFDVGETRGKEIANLPTLRGYMVDETVGFIGELIRRNDSILKIVDSDFAYLNQPLAAHYGIPAVNGIALKPVAIKPEHKLGGLLTHGSVLIGNGTGTAPHPIYRAVWLREAILGDEVEPPPADVPALTDTVGASAEDAISIKDLLRIHRTKESCNDCHFRLDPWGIPFEHYNAIGKYQPAVPVNGSKIKNFDRRTFVDHQAYNTYLASLNTVKIDASARLPTGTDVKGMEDLKKYLLANRRDDIARNLIRRFLTYGLGRKLTHNDRGAVEDILQQTKKDGLKFKDLIITICRSPLMMSTNYTNSNK